MRFKETKLLTYTGLSHDPDFQSEEIKEGDKHIFPVCEENGERVGKSDLVKWSRKWLC